jgi:hypothetical protein
MSERPIRAHRRARIPAGDGNDLDNPEEVLLPDVTRRKMSSPTTKRRAPSSTATAVCAAV